MDLMAFIESSIKIAPNSSALVPTGISVAISNDVEIQIRPRSGLAVKSNISVLSDQRKCLTLARPKNMYTYQIVITAYRGLPYRKF